VNRMTLTVKLAEREQKRLEVIAIAMNVNQSDVVRALINEKFESLQADKTLLERRGGHPKFLLDGPTDMSERSKRKALVAQKLSAKASRRAR